MRSACAARFRRFDPSEGPRARRDGPGPTPAHAAGALRCELRGLVFGGQRVDQFAERFAGDHLRQFVECQVDAVIGDAALREIVGADALAAVAGADLLLAVGRARGVDALALGVIDARAQDVHRRRAVLVLGTAVLHHDHDAGRDVGDADRRFGLVDVLAAGALRAHGLDPQIIVLDVDVDFLGPRAARRRWRPRCGCALASRYRARAAPGARRIRISALRTRRGPAPRR